MEKVKKKLGRPKGSKGRPKGRTSESIFDKHTDMMLELRRLGLSFEKIAAYLQLGTGAGVYYHLQKLKKINE